MEGFKQVRESLIDMLEELDERLEKIAHDDVEHGGEMDEIGILDKDEDTTGEIEKIKQAISQIDAGSYGICLQCGQAIKKEQLNSSPLSQRCIYCVTQ